MSEERIYKKSSHVMDYMMLGVQSCCAIFFAWFLYCAASEIAPFYFFSFCYLYVFFFTQVFSNIVEGYKLTDILNESIDELWELEARIEKLKAEAKGELC